MSGRRSSKATDLRRRAPSRTSGPSRSRPISRRSACSSSSTSTSTNGTSSNPGRNDWRTTVQDRTVPRPLTGANVKSGSVLPQCGTRRRADARTRRTASSARRVSTCRAAAAQNGADCSSGTGTGRVTADSPLTGSPWRLQRADLVPVVAESRSGSSFGVLAVLGRTAQLWRAAPSNCTGTVGQPVRQATVRSRPRRRSRWRAPAGRRAAPDRLHRRPRRVERRPATAFHSSKRALGEFRIQCSATQASAVLRLRLARSTNRGSSTQVGTVDDVRQNSAPVPVAPARNTSGMWRPSLVGRPPTSGFGRATAAGRRLRIRAVAARRAGPTTASTSRSRAATRRPPTRAGTCRA